MAKFREASNCCKKVPKSAKLAQAGKIRESINSKKLVSHKV